MPHLSARLTRSLALLLAGLSASLASAATRYVDANLATGANDGTSWADAYRGPQALATAMNAAVAGDEIWVAAGTYTASPSNRLSSHILRNGVTVLGGFAGGETSAEERDFLANVCTMSGDLLGNDTASNTSRNDNSYHVITVLTGSTAVLDGFTVRAGYANSSTSNRDRGAGIICLSNHSPTIRNCRFIDNRCTFGGGAGYVNGSAPKFLFCDFIDNDSAAYGGAFDCAGAGAVTFESCRFFGNTAARAGALEFFVSQPRVTNCLFVGNVSTGSGGGGAIWLGNGSSGTLRNLTVVGNTSNVTAGAIYNTGGTTTIANSIVWGNTGPGTVQQDGVRSAGGTTSVTWSCIQGGASGSTNFAADPLFADEAGGDYRLSIASPCIDAGANGSVPSGVTTDLDGNPRFVDVPEVPDTGSGAPPIVDLGAYEFQVEPNPCPADLDGDGVVGPSDLAILLSAWGETGGKSGPPPADLDGDGTVGAGDLAILLSAWGACA